MTLLKTMMTGIRASTNLDQMKLSNDGDTSLTGAGRGMIEYVNDSRASYEQVYRTQIWVRTVVDKLSRGVASLPLKTYTMDAGGQRQRVRDGWLPDLLARPYAGCSPFHFKQSIVANMGVHGNAIAVKVRGKAGQPPAELVPSNWAYWRVVPGRERPVDWYVFGDHSRTQIPFRPEEVIHWRWWAPGQGIVAPSPIEALKRTLSVEDAAQRTQISSFEHGTRPMGAYSVQTQLSDETATRLRAQLEETYGGVDNAYKIMLLEGGAKWEPMSGSMVDAELINARKLTREEVAAVYDIPPPMIHILDRATFSNIDEQHRMLYQDTLRPWLTMFEETLATQLIDQEPTMAGLFVEFDLAEVLKGDLPKRYDAYRKAWWMTANEIRRTENLGPLDDPLADQIFPPQTFLNREEEEEARGKQAAAHSPIPEARCPNCSSLLARNVTGAELRCGKCKLTTAVGTTTEVTA